MTLREEMMSVALGASRVLGDATDLITTFLESQIHPRGGMMNRAGDSDLYYGFFGLECQQVLQMPFDQHLWQTYLNSFDRNYGEDLVHLSCLIRCWANMPKTLFSENLRQHFLRRLQEFKCQDGSFHTLKGQSKGSAYGCFVAMDTYHNLGSEVPSPEAMIDRILKVQTPTGAFAFEEGMPEGTTPTTAAAIVALTSLKVPLNRLEQGKDWLLARWQDNGGILAVPEAPMPDLLSTATALHTLSKLGVNFEDKKERCLDFVDSLWVNKGGFYAHWSDDILDVEYLFYALLALGHLAD
jgi:prenyltransferase beta subunit